MGPEVRLLHVHDQIKAGKVKEVMQHELIHMAADPTLNRPDGMPLNEGITQWLTEGIHPPKNGVPLVDRPYANEVAQVRLLADQVGREAVLDAFHRGGVPELERLQTSPPVRPDIDLEAVYNNSFAPTETSPVWTDDPTAP